MFECLKDKYKQDFILRSDLKKITGGIINQHTFGSRSYRHSPDRPRAIKIGNKSVYRIDDIISWLEAQKIDEIKE